MEEKICRTCKDNEDGLCNRKGILVTDDHTCRKWQQELITEQSTVLSTTNTNGTAGMLGKKRGG